MPELPEVHTTVTGLQIVLQGLKVIDVWTSYNSSFHAGKENIKNPIYFRKFKKNIVGQKITGTSRRGKNVLIHLKNGFTILVHMKMTGHLLYGRYSKRKIKSEKGKVKEEWTPAENGPLQDPKNRWIRFVVTLSNGKHLAFSDLRKFGKITLIETKKLYESDDLKNLGHEPLEKNFKFLNFKEVLFKRPNGRIKTVLMNQNLISGIGNIYSDEILWEAGVHPESKPQSIPNAQFQKMFKVMKKTLSRGIDFGGDSTSDYRNIFGKPGKFHHTHQAYRRSGERCRNHGCKGIIHRKKIGGRSGHFCQKHQKLFN